MRGLAAWALGFSLVAPGQQPSTAEGADIYARTCGRCHNARSPLERTDREILEYLRKVQR